MSTNSFWGQFASRGSRTLRIPMNTTDIQSMVKQTVNDLLSARRQVSSAGPPKLPARRPVRSQTANELDRLRDRHQREKQTLIDEINDLRPYATRSEPTNPHRSSTWADSSRVEQSSLAHEAEYRRTELQTERLREMERRQSETMSQIDQQITNLSLQYRTQQNQARRARWNSHCNKLNTDMARLQNARDTRRTVSMFNARIDTISCNSCFSRIKRDEEFFCKYPLLSLWQSNVLR